MTVALQENGLPVERVGLVPRAVWVLGCGVAGVILATTITDAVPVYAWWLAACACALGSVVARGRWVWVLLAASVVCAMSGWTTVRTQRVAQDWMGTWLDDTQETAVWVEGVVVGRPAAGRMQEGVFARFTFNADVTRFRLRARQVTRADGGVVDASGDLLVRVRGGLPGDVAVGDVISLRGMARRVGVARNPGDAFSQERAVQDSVAGVVDVPGAALVERIGAASGLYWGAVRARELLLARAMRVVEGVEGTSGVLLRAVLFGERSRGYEELSSVFARAGAAHLLAISGLHLGFFALVLLGVARVVGGGSRWEWVFVCGCVLMYVWLMPARVPIVRAGVMTVVLLAGVGFGRRYRVGSVLGWAGVLVLVWRPMDVFAAGMQLSFGVVAGLVVLLGWWEKFRRERGAAMFDAQGVWSGVRRRGGEALVVAVGAWLVSLPLVWVHFGEVHAWSAVGALVLTVLFGVLVSAGFVGSVVAMVWPAGGGMFAGVLGAGADAIAWVVRVLSELPGASVSLMPVDVVWAWVVLTVAWWFVARRKAKRREFWIRAAAASGCVVWLGAQVLAGLGNGVGGAALRMETLSVGDGTCHVLRTRERVVVWDAGSSSVGSGQRLVRAMRASGVWRVDVLVLTHANLDHYSLVPAVQEAFGIGRVVTSQAFGEALEAGENAVGVLRQELGETPVRIVTAGDVLVLGEGVEMEFLWPAAGETFAEVNDSSLVGLVRVTTRGGERRVLMTGDIEDEGIQGVRAAMESRGIVGADVLELPHHGSARKEAMAFTKWIDPLVVVQSTGALRAHDPRWGDVRTGRQWYSTAEVGAVRTVIEKDGTVRVGAIWADDKRAAQLMSLMRPKSGMGMMPAWWGEGK